MKRVLVVLALGTCATAAGQECPPSPGPQPCYTEKCCDPSLNGNPVFMSRSGSFYRKRDFSVAAPGGELEFLRTFTGDPTLWDKWPVVGQGVLTGIPVPFGNAPAEGSATTIGGPLRWTHNLFSLLYHVPTGTKAGYYVRDLGGTAAQFSLCTVGVDCWATPRSESPSTYGNLKVLNVSAPTGFEYTQPCGARQLMSA